MKLVVSALLILGLLGNAVQGMEIRFTPLPMEKSKVVIEQVKPMLSYLQAATGQQFKIEFFSNYEEIIENFQAGNTDLAFLGPLPYVILAQKQPSVSPLVRFLNAQGKDTYTCALLHIMDETMAPLANRRLALTQPHSTCGYLSMAYLLKKLGGDIEQMRYRYVGSHSEAALGLARGEFDLSGVKTSIGQKFAHLGLEVVAETQPLPGFVLAGNAQTLPAKVLQNIAAALLKLQPLSNASDAAITRRWGSNVRYGSVPADDADFAAIRDKLRDLQIPLKGNF